jgi:hypothetical protein
VAKPTLSNITRAPTYSLPTGAAPHTLSTKLHLHNSPPIYTKSKLAATCGAYSTIKFVLLHIQMTISSYHGQRDVNEQGRQGIRRIRPRRETNIIVHEGAVYMRGILLHGILNEKIMAAVGMKASRNRGALLAAQSSVVRILEPRTSIGDTPCLAAFCDPATSRRTIRKTRA